MAKRKKTKNEEEVQLVLMTNDRQQFKVSTLQVIYQAADYRQLAYMDGMDPDTGEIVPLLVGLETLSDEQFNVWPLAIILNKSKQIKNYLVPNGRGDYVDRRPKQAQESGQTVERGEEASL